MAIALTALSSLSAHAGEIDAALKCTRDVIQSKKIDKDTLIQFGKVLDGVTANGSADQLLSNCKAIKTAVSSLPRRSGKEIAADFAALEMTNQVSFGSLGILKMFSQPVTSCTVLGIDADVAIGVGVGAGVAFGECRSESGRKFGVMVPMVSALVGLMADAQIVDWKFQYASNEFVSAHDGILMGLVLSFRADQLDFGFGRTDTEAVGVGIGIAGESTLTLPIKLLPLGNDFTEIKSILRIK